MVYKLLDSSSPSLSVKLPEITIEELKEKHNLTPQELKDNLVKTMQNYRGIGLSANQCGLPIRAFVMYTNLRTDEFELYINPKITYESEETEMFTEGCLTYPFLFLSLKRPKFIEFTYLDMEGKEQTGKFTGLTSRVFQHEYDHMQGKNFTMLASRLKLDLAQKKADKKLKRALKRKEEML